MKLHEITGSQFLSNRKAILRWIENNCTCNSDGESIEDKITINSDWSVDVNEDIYFNIFPEFKVRFNRVDGSVTFEDGECHLKSLAGCPQYISGTFDAENALSKSITSMENGPLSVDDIYCIINAKGISTFDFIPKLSNTVDIRKTKIISLVGISDHFESLTDIIVTVNQIKAGGLGLLNIPTFTKIYDYIGASKWQVIINKYAGTDNIIECQSELIEAGYEDYAIL